MLNVIEIKRLLLSFHSERGYRIFDSFPMLANDPTVMFINATITPFKNWFTNAKIAPCNFALVQKCFRAGVPIGVNGAGFNPSIQTFFEMFGTGTFGINHATAVSYLLDIMNVLGIEKEKLYFTIPPNDDFRKGLEANGISSYRVYTIESNDVFWCDWKFGKQGPRGNGLTVIYSAKNRNVSKVEQLLSDDSNFVELLNLIHIYGQEAQDGSIIPAANPGFEIGMGIGRAASILQECDGYQIDNVRPLVETITKYFSIQGYEVSDVISKVCTDYLRGTCMLLNEGILPSNKGAGYVLRKIIRRFMEHIWLVTGEPIFVEDLIEEFVYLLSFHDSFLKISRSDITDALRKEHCLLKEVLMRGIKIIQKKPGISGEVLSDTYGLSPGLITLAKKGEMP